MTLIISLSIFFMSIMLHEFAHGWVAYKLGDPTAKYSGRLTLNPLAHIDTFGTVLLPFMLLMIKSPVVFGWAKPVPVNFWNLRKPKRDMIFVGLSGPATNFLIASILSIFLKENLFAFLDQILEMAIWINLVLGVFNLIPIPPLDGSRLIAGLLPNKYLFIYSKLEAYGILIIFLLLFLGLFDLLIWPIVGILGNLLGLKS